MADNTFTVTLDPHQAWALAQYLKRVCHDDIRLRSVDREECGLIKEAMALVQRSLAEKGYAPR